MSSAQVFRGGGGIAQAAVLGAYACQVDADWDLVHAMLAAAGSAAGGQGATQDSQGWDEWQDSEDEGAPEVLQHKEELDQVCMPESRTDLSPALQQYKAGTQQAQSKYTDEYRDLIKQPGLCGQVLSLVGAAKLLRDLGCPMTLAQLRDCDAAGQIRITQTLLARLSRSQPPLTDQRCGTHSCNCTCD